MPGQAGHDEEPFERAALFLCLRHASSARVVFAKQAQGDRRFTSSDGLSLTPTPDYGPWRKAIGPTVRVRPIELRLFGGKAAVAAE